MLTVHWKSGSIFLTKDINDQTNQIWGYDHTKPKYAGVSELEAKDQMERRWLTKVDGSAACLWASSGPQHVFVRPSECFSIFNLLPTFKIRRNYIKGHISTSMRKIECPARLGLYSCMTTMSICLKKVSPSECPKPQHSLLSYSSLLYSFILLDWHLQAFELHHM